MTLDSMTASYEYAYEDAVRYELSMSGKVCHCCGRQFS